MNFNNEISDALALKGHREAPRAVMMLNQKEDAAARGSGRPRVLE